MKFGRSTQRGCNGQGGRQPGWHWAPLTVVAATWAWKTCWLFILQDINQFSELEDTVLNHPTWTSSALFSYWKSVRVKHFLHHPTFHQWLLFCWTCLAVDKLLFTGWFYSELQHGFSLFFHGKQNLSSFILSCSCLSWECLLSGWIFHGLLLSFPIPDCSLLLNFHMNKKAEATTAVFLSR